MKKVSLWVCLFFILALMVSGCNLLSSGDDSSNNAVIRGTVTDPAGQPLVGVKFFIEYYTQSNPAKPATSISFNLPETTSLKAWVTPFFSSDTVIVLIDDILERGDHTVVWNAKNSSGLFVPGNFYYAHIKTPDSYSKKQLFFNYFNNNMYSVYQELAVTDSFGKYSININELAFSNPNNLVEDYDDNGNVTGTSHVVRTVKLWVIDGIHASKCIEIENIPSNSDILQDIVLLNRQ